METEKLDSNLAEGSHEITYEFTPVGGTKSDRSTPLNITSGATTTDIPSGVSVSIGRTVVPIKLSTP